MTDACDGPEAALARPTSRFFLPSNLHIYCTPSKLHAGHRPAMRNHHIYCAHRPPFIYHNHSNVNRTTARRVLQSPRPHPSWHRASMTYVFIFIERNQHINWSSKQGLSITITQASWMPIPGCHDDGKLTVL